jgi:hypothetical protein
MSCRFYEDEGPAQAGLPRILDEHDKARKDLDRARHINPSTRPWQERFREFKGMF